MRFGGLYDNQHMKKYIVGAILSIGILITPAFTQAAGLTSAQISAIIGLLQSLGVDQTTINNVQISLNGGMPTTGGQSFCHNFNTNLTINSGGGDVRALDKVLLKEGVGNPTSFEGQPATLISDDGVFIENTAAAVVGFQAKYGIRQTGYVGPITRAKLNALYGCNWNGQ